MGKKNGGSPPPIGHNEAEIREAIASRTKDIVALEAKRADINADINAHRKAIRALGIDLDAWRAAKRRKEMDPDVRAEFDRSATLVNEALGIPVQADLFAAPPAGDNAGPIPSALN